MREQHSTSTIEAAAQHLANVIGPRRWWVLVIDDPQGEPLLFSNETPERVRELLRRGSARRRP